ncbi:MAG: EAL domain-containing protein, partial [Epsilonproteobacteria bacterium]|nr:EAL domain-containing protein [Campylobacterota bacterium]
PSTITLEILEGITSTGAKNNIDKLNRLKKHGFLIAIDDFGVEYSNFERIKDLDIDFIKIDGKYTKEITTNKKSLTIVKAITSFAHSMDIKVIAEFVENETIFNTLKEMEVDASQGYYFHKPEKLNDILRNLL